MCHCLRDITLSSNGLYVLGGLFHAKISNTCAKIQWWGEFCALARLKY